MRNPITSRITDFIYRKVEPISDKAEHNRHKTGKELEELKRSYQQWLKTDSGQDFVNEMQHQINDLFQQSMRASDPHTKALLIEQAKGLYEAAQYVQRMGTIKDE